jgi:nucleoside-diphosphate-sugar epimerase
VKVLVTGGTGFVGAHSVKALLDAGHTVRMLVRSPDRIGAALGPLGTQAPEHVVGDVTDADSVRRALTGCDAVLHAASVYTFDARRAASMRRDNMASVRIVLGSAHELGHDPIVHVSSFAALLPAQAPLTPGTPVGEPKGAYNISKAETEQVARDMQSAGAPVVITYPGMVWGPHDPHLGESANFARDILRGLLPVRIGGGPPVVHVRDVAAVHAAVMEPGRGPRRYLATGEIVPFARIYGLLRGITGRRLPALRVPVAAAIGSGLAADAAQRVVPFRLPLNSTGPWLGSHAVPGDDHATREELGVAFRPAPEAIADTVRWLYDAGHISARQAGRAAS